MLAQASTITKHDGQQNIQQVICLLKSLLIDLPPVAIYKKETFKLLKQTLALFQNTGIILVLLNSYQKYL